MNRQEALALAHQIEADMGEPRDKYGWAYIAPDDDAPDDDAPDDSGRWAVYFSDFPDVVHSPQEWEQIRPLPNGGCIVQLMGD